LATEIGMEIDIVEQALSISISIFDSVEQPLSISISISFSISIPKIDTVERPLNNIFTHEPNFAIRPALLNV
jgi:hypothetical protein